MAEALGQGNTDTETRGQTEFRRIFIGGCPRSGTTLVQAVLMQTGAVATAPETHLFPQYIGRFYRVWERFCAKKSEGHRDIGLHRVLSQEQFDAALRQFADGVLERIQGNKRKPIVAEKTPENMLVWKDIVRLYPDACFVHVVRDPRAVVASTKAAREWAAEWAYAGVDEICQRWMKYLDAADECRRAGVALVEARYERIAGGDARYVGSLLRQLGIRRTRAQVYELCAAVEMGKLKQRAHKYGAFFYGEPEGFFRKGEAQSWREELPPEEIALIESLTGDYMRRAGYMAVSGH